MDCIDQIENFIGAKVDLALAGRLLKATNLIELGRNVQITRGELDQCLRKS